MLYQRGILEEEERKRRLNRKSADAAYHNATELLECLAELMPSTQAIAVKRLTQGNCPTRAAHGQFPRNLREKDA
jgi:hypothetical protein